MKFKPYFVGSLIYTIFGIGHMIAEFISRIFLNPSNNELYAQMSRYYLTVFGVSRSILDYMHGFSLTMGFLLFSFGALNLLLYIKGQQFIDATKGVPLFNFLISAVVTGVSVIYFHWAAILGYSVAGLCFLIAYKNTK